MMMIIMNNEERNENDEMTKMNSNNENGDEMKMKWPMIVLNNMKKNNEKWRKIMK